MLLTGNIKRQLGLLIAAALIQTPAYAEQPQPQKTLSQACTSGILQAAAEQANAGIILGEINNILTGEKIPGGVKYVPASDTLPGYCKVTGSFVTNEQTGKTANFLATLPENWNGKYLQYGCFGTCGFFWFNDASSPQVDIIAQGKPGDSLRKGYASFSTDEGHQGHEPVSWAEKGLGKVDREAIDDYLYRATMALAPAAKKFTAAFYSDIHGGPRTIEKSYFTGCSGGGRNALVAASYYPEEFDGFIAGSPAADLVGMSFYSAAFSLATQRPGYVAISADQVTLLNSIVNTQCDAMDGVKDGLIQNPAACNFTPEKNLPQCDGLEPGADCFTKPQIEALSVLVTAVVDEQGRLVYPGIAVSNIGLSQSKIAIEGKRAEGLLRVMMFGNAEDFNLESLIKLVPGKDGVSLQAVVDSASVEAARQAMGKGVVDVPEKLGTMISQNRKLMIWHDLSDNTLTPYETINFYAQLAEGHSGIDSVSETVRLMTLPGTGHCSGGFTGVGPNSFDALTAMERWVEHGEKPNDLMATHYPGTEFGKDLTQPAGRSMPLCQFPQMARYSGDGDVHEGSNWRCVAGDSSMLTVGASGLRAGINHSPRASKP